MSHKVNAKEFGWGARGRSVTYGVGMANLATGMLGAAAFGYFDSSLAPGFALGFIIAVANIFWLMRSVRKLASLSSMKAASVIARNYYMRFAATVAIFFLIVSQELANLLPLIAGFTVSIFTTVGMLILYSLKEVSEDA
jgi:hypothetical protein